MGLFNRSGGPSGSPLESGDSVYGLRGRTKGSRGKVKSVQNTDMGFKALVEWENGTTEEVSPSEVRGTNDF